MNPEGGTICLGDDIEFGKARIGNTESVKYTVVATYEDGRTRSIANPNFVTAGQRKAVADILAPLGDTSGIESFVMEVSGFSNTGGCNSNSGRSRFVAYELYDDSLVELGGMDIQSINVPAFTFAENINRARAPQRVFFSPPFRPTVLRYTVKMDPGEQAIFVTPIVLCKRSQVIDISAQPTPDNLEPFGDYYYEVPGESLFFTVTVKQLTNFSEFQVYSFTVDKSVDEGSFITSVEGLALIFACVAFVLIAAGGVYYANKNAQRQLKMIEEQDFDTFEEFDKDGNSVGVVPSSSACPPCVHCGTALASPRDKFCRSCGTEQPERHLQSPSLSPAVAVVGSSNSFCRNCGKPAKSASDKFCWHCGTPAPTIN
jgi:hypothetical protein